MKTSYSEESNDGIKCQFILLVEIYEESFEEMLKNTLVETLTSEINKQIISMLINGMEEDTSTIHAFDNERN